MTYLYSRSGAAEATLHFNQIEVVWGEIGRPLADGVTWKAENGQGDEVRHHLPALVLGLIFSWSSGSFHFNITTACLSTSRGRKQKCCGGWSRTDGHFLSQQSSSCSSRSLLHCRSSHRSSFGSPNKIISSSVIFCFPLD